MRIWTIKCIAVGLFTFLIGSASAQDPGDLRQYEREPIGKMFTFRNITGDISGLAAGGENGIYATGSTLATAAVHAGRLGKDQVGDLTIELLGPQEQLGGSTRNGVVGRKVRARCEGSFRFVIDPLPIGRIAWESPNPKVSTKRTEHIFGELQHPTLMSTVVEGNIARIWIDGAWLPALVHLPYYREVTYLSFEPPVSSGQQPTATVGLVPTQHRVKVEDHRVEFLAANHRNYYKYETAPEQTLIDRNGQLVKNADGQNYETRGFRKFPEHALPIYKIKYGGIHRDAYVVLVSGEPIIPFLPHSGSAFAITWYDLDGCFLVAHGAKVIRTEVDTSFLVFPPGN